MSSDHDDRAADDQHDGLQRRHLREGLAAKAVTVAEMGGTDADVIAAVTTDLVRLDMLNAADVREVAAAVATLPQPHDEPAEERERRRQIEDMLGLTSPEDQLLASIRARDALTTLAERLDRPQ